jgi:hypothetical protein
MIQPKKHLSLPDPLAKQVRAYHIGVDRDLVRQFSLIFVNFLLLTYLLLVQFQVLDSFFSTIPVFKTDSDSISPQTQSAESADASLAGHGAGSSRTRAGKHKSTNTPPQKKKSQKEVPNRASRIKINDPASNPSPAPTTEGGFISTDPTGTLNWNLSLCWLHFFTSPIVQNPTRYLSKLLYEGS